ncbi:hypothetical protein [Nocardioides xinjiangensis]|uniref:hypothetical protein n=1 Tax=Nocardioides xinjiangensis TaxID=2817376 RepID=UPI001B305516|nr:MULTISPECIES: hypothetical protein [unclassified Nocardioides]
MESSVFISLGSLVLGSGLTFGLEVLRHKRTRNDTVQDARRLERSQAYVDFLNSAHDAAHLLGRSTPGCPNPLDADGAVYWTLDSDVTRRLRVIEIVGAEAVTGAARMLRAALDDFRAATTRPGMVYATDEYWHEYSNVARHRDSFIESARHDLRTTS